MTSGPWPALVKAALLGTERTGRPVAGGGGGTGAVGLLLDAVAADPGRSPERALLASAGALATARRAGRVPERPAVQAPPPAPPLDRPEVGEEAGATLAALVAGTWRQLLPEWLEACAARGRRVPSVQLPSLLDLAVAQRALRPLVLGALGDRGRWLAAQRPEWRWAVGAAAGEVPDDPARAWDEGTSAERRALLAAVRAVDPDLGRSLVESTWPTDKADERAAFVGLLVPELSMADEPFLEERARIDRARDVRQAAATALAHLPASRLAARMQQRARDHVDSRRLPGELAVRLPEELPAAWMADGVERAARRHVGERAWWLRQVVASTPLDTWGPASEAVAAASRADHGDVLLLGWAAAATRQRRGDWAAALLDVPAGPEPEGLLRILDPVPRAVWLARALEAAPGPQAAGLVSLCAEVPRPWPSSLVQVAAGRAAALVLGPPGGAHLARPALLLAAERADPATLPRFAAELAQAMRSERRLEAELRRPLAVAQLRQDVLAELAR